MAFTIDKFIEDITYLASNQLTGTLTLPTELTSVNPQLDVAQKTLTLTITAPVNVSIDQDNPDQINLTIGAV